MKQVWKPIDGMVHYEVSNLGQVRNSKGDILKAAKATGNKAPFVTLYDKGVSKTCGIGRAVAIAFVPKPEGMNRVSYIDGDNTNCREDNIKWYK